MLSAISAAPYCLPGERSGRQPRPPLPGAMAFPYGRLLPTTLGEVYGYPPSQPVASIQLVPVRPPGQSRSHRPSFQDGTGLDFYHHASLAPVRLAERGASAQAVPEPPTSGRPLLLVLREIDHQTVGASAPTSRSCTAGPKAGDFESPPGASTSSVAEGPSFPLGEPAETKREDSLSHSYSQFSSAGPSSSSAEGFAENLKTLQAGSHGGDVEINTALESHLLAPAQETSLLMGSRDEIQVPENLATEFPDFEELISSMEPLLPDCVLPSLDSPQPRDSWQGEELLETPPDPCGIRGQSQEPEASKAGSIPRASQGKPSRAPWEPKHSTKVKRRKPPPNEGEPSRKVPKTNRSSDPTTGPHSSGGATALRAQKKDCRSLQSGQKEGSRTPTKTAKGLAKRELRGACSLTGWSLEAEKDRAPRKLSNEAKEKLKSLMTAVGRPKQVSAGPSLQTNPHKADPEKRQPQPQGQGRAKAGAPFPGARGKKKETKMAVQEPPKPVARSRLALQMTESLNVFYPLGKGKLPTAPVKKQLPLAPSAPAKPLPVMGTWAAPLTSLPKIPNLSASSSALQPPSQPSSIPVLSSMPFPRQRPAPNTSFSSRPCDPKESSSQLYQASGWRLQASTSRKTTGPLPHPPMSGQIHWRAAANTQASTVVVRRPVLRPASPTYKGDTFIPWRTPPRDLEVSKPITEEQRPIREMMKRRAQQEREEAARWTSVGRVKYFVEREKEMDLSIACGYPWRY